jgi:hypothetical protein
MLKIEIEQLCASYLRGDTTDADSVIRACYAHFAKTKSLKNLTDDNWVALARGKNDVRYFLNYCYSDGENYVACDGHRLHMLKNVSYTPDTFYDKNKVPQVVDGTYPDYKRVIPTDIDTLGRISDLDIVIGYHNNKKYVKINNKITLLKEYFDEAKSGFNGDDIVSANELKKQFIIDSSSRLAVIAGTNISDSEFTPA